MDELWKCGVFILAEKVKVAEAEAAVFNMFIVQMLVSSGIRSIHVKAVFHNQYKTHCSLFLCFSSKKNKTQMKSRAPHDILGGCQNFVSERNQAAFISVLKASSHISQRLHNACYGHTLKDYDRMKIILML